MGDYARSTGVSVDASMKEIRRVLQRFGADGFRPTEDWANARTAIEFTFRGRLIRFILKLPPLDDYRLTPTMKKRKESAAIAAWEQACRQKWRALALSIKAKLVRTEDDIASFEHEFLANIVDPESGRTVGEVILPQLKCSYEQSPRPLLLTMEKT